MVNQNKNFKRQNLILLVLVILSITTAFVHFIIFSFSNIFLSKQFLIFRQLNNILDFEIIRNDKNISKDDLQITLSSNLVNIFIDLKNFNFQKLGLNHFQVPLFINGIFELNIFNKKEKIFSKIINFFPNFAEIENPNNYTVLNCHGNSFKDNWCEAQNVCFFGKKLIFYSPYNLLFSDEFINPSSHTPPYHREDSTIGRKTIKVVTTNNAIIKDWSNATGIIASRYFNHMMLWHNLMDFVVPIYATIHNSSFTEKEKDNCQVIAYDDDGKFGLFYVRPLCPNNDIIPGFASDECFKNIIIGTVKNIGKQNESKINLQYNIKHQQIKGMREKMLKGMNKSECRVNPQHPKIAIITRKQNKGKEEKRMIINIDEVVSETKRVCPICNVEKIDLQSMTKQEQVRYACDLSLLVGIHGSGLIHALWMQESTKRHRTGLVEILPYMYNCRDWYHKLASMAGVDYIPIPTKLLSQSRWSQWHDPNKVKRCHSDKTLCTKGSCHDFLRDQSVIVDIKQYRKAIQPFVKTFYHD